MDNAELRRLEENVRRIREKSPNISQLCVPVSKRVDKLYEVQSAKQVLQTKPAILFCQLVADFLRALREYDYRRYVLYRLARYPTLVDQVRRAHYRLDEVYFELGIQEDEELANAWVASWKTDLDAQDAHFIADVSRTPAQVLISDIQSQPHREEILAEMEKQKNVRGSEPELATIHRPGRHPVQIQPSVSRDMLNLIMTKYDNIQDFLNRAEPEVEFKWFVVARSVSVERKKFAAGPFSKLYHASWDDAPNNRRYTKIVYKLLISDVTANAAKLFYREIAVWWGLDHKNILKLYGANHVTRFFLCEFANRGNFASFFEKDENSSLLWSLFIQAGNGLIYLHSQGIEYGGVKCNNLLLKTGEDAELVVKLSDFGMSAVRNNSVVMSAEAKSDTARWKAPERLENNGDRRIDFEKSDVYSFGLCIIEAVTKETPFGMTDSETIVNMKLDRIPIDRPEEVFTDDEWTLVSKMCDPYPENRPAMVDVLNEMTQLDLVRRGVTDAAMAG